MGTAWNLEDPGLWRFLKRIVGAQCPLSYGPELCQEVLGETLTRLIRLGDLPDGRKREFCATFLWTTSARVSSEVIRRKKSEGNAILAA